MNCVPLLFTTCTVIVLSYGMYEGIITTFILNMQISTIRVTCSNQYIISHLDPFTIVHSAFSSMLYINILMMQSTDGFDLTSSWIIGA